MTRNVRLPRVETNSRIVSADEVEALAVRWLAEINRAAGSDDAPVGVVLPASAAGLALFAAASARPGWLLLLPPDPATWTTSLGIPTSMLVVLPPRSEQSDAPLTTSSIETGAQRIGCRTLTVSEAEASPASDPRAAETTVTRRDFKLLQSAGVVLFTSGSTGEPKPVFRRMTALIDGVSARLDALQLQDGDGVIAGVSLAHGHGLTRMLSAMRLGGAFGLLDPLDHRAALAMLARPGYALWSATAHFADLLGRCALSAPPIAPRVCLVSSPLSSLVVERFRERFGVPLRQSYSSTETGAIAVDASPTDDVQADTVGRLLPGIELTIGETAESPVANGDAGRIWIRSPWLMSGYGFPPALTGVQPGGWWGTRDVGVLRPDGRLQLSGRLDDNIRTRDGRLLNLATVAGLLRQVEGIGDAAVVPIQRPAGASFGAVLQCADDLSLAVIRDRVTASVPKWAWPRALVQVGSLPRLASGKIDRRTCVALLDGGTS